MKTDRYSLKNGVQISVRLAVPADAVALLDYIEQVNGETTFLSMGPGEFELDAAQEAAFIETCQRAPNRAYFVAFVEDELVAVSHVNASQRQRLRHRGEFGMSVRRQFWGLGIGAIVLDHLVAWAKNNPVLTKLDLQVRADNQRAIELYRRYGFTEEGSLRKQIRIDSVYFDTLAMGMEV